MQRMEEIAISQLQSTGGMFLVEMSAGSKRQLITLRLSSLDRSMSVNSLGHLTHYYLVQLYEE